MLKCLISPSVLKLHGRRPHFGKLSTFFDALYAIYQLSEIKDDIQAVSQFPCLLGHAEIELWIKGTVDVIHNSKPSSQQQWVK